MIVAFCLLSIQASAQCNKIIGKWLNKDDKGQIQIYLQNSEYNGKLIWIKGDKEKNQLLTDQRNIRPKLRKRLLLGLNILKGFNCGGSNYSGGTIYDPRRGKSFNCTLTLSGDKLKINAYMGMFLAGTETWTRVK